MRVLTGSEYGVRVLTGSELGKGTGWNRIRCEVLTGSE